MSRTDYQMKLRLPPGLRERIERAARDNGRSMNSEIVNTLEPLYPEPPSTDRLIRDMSVLMGFVKRRPHNQRALLDLVAQMEELRSLLVSPETEGQFELKELDD